MDYTATLEEQDLRDDYLAAPPRNVAIVAAVLAAAVVVICVGSALAGNPWPAIISAPFLAGGVVGLFAYRCPIRWACAAILAASAFVALKEGGYALWFVPALVFVVVPTTILGAILTAAVRRYRRGRHARRLLGIVLD